MAKIFLQEKDRNGNKPKLTKGTAIRVWVPAGYGYMIYNGSKIEVTNGESAPFTYQGGNIEIGLQPNSGTVNQIRHPNSSSVVHGVNPADGAMHVYILGGYTERPTPTYLETLDKLDQWSTAQYTPNSGNKLNL